LDGLVENSPNRLDEAIELASAAILARQRNDGSWECTVDVGPVAVATQLVLEQTLGRLGEADRQAGLAALVASQRADGAYPAYPTADRGSASVTALAVAAMGRCLRPEDGATLRRAREALERLGGHAAVVDAFRARGDVAALFLVGHGSLDADLLPRLPLAIALVPGLERLLDGRFHPGNLMGALVLAALGQRPRQVARWTRALERRRAVDYLASWQNPSGSWNQALFPTQLMALGLHALGVHASDPVMRAATRWMDRQKTVVEGELVLQAIPNDIWSTAQACLALVDGGDGPASGEAVVRARRFFAAEQIMTEQPRANQRRRGAPRRGGWAYQRANPTMPDCDDTGMVLAALGAGQPPDALGAATDVMRCGERWLRGMQNPDGGWGAYVWNLTSKPRGAMFSDDIALPLDDPRGALALWRRPPPELGDPATEGVTARALQGLGACGFGPDDTVVKRALCFLEAQQHASGAFWDRWMTCYLPGTASVVSGLMAVGTDPNQPIVRRAVDWLRGQQNPDGGFGETPAAFRDPGAAGRGPSMAPVTGFVASALIDAGWGADDVTLRAVRWLLDEQQADGGWSNGGWVNPYVPPDTFYLYPWSAQCTPLSALGKYRRRAGSASP
jgi:squalene cyclase